MKTMMNGMQLCGAAEARCDLRAAQRRCASAPPALRRSSTRPGLDLDLGLAAVLAGALVAGLAAAVLTVARTGQPEPLPVVELARAVVAARPLPPVACPVPVDAAATDCPVPIDARPATAGMNTTARRTQP